MDSTEKRCTRADREAVVEVLSQHYAAGSLDDGEFSERTDMAMAAKFQSELSGLLTDLPDLAPAQAEPLPLPQPGPFGYAPQDRFVLVHGRRVDLRYADRRVLAGKDWRPDPQAGRGMNTWHGMNASVRRLPWPVQILIALGLAILAIGLWPVTITAVIVFLAIKAVRFWKQQGESSM